MSDDKMKLEAKILARVKERDKLAAEIQSDIEALAGKINKFCDRDLKTYEMLSGPDCLYGDSPISKTWTCEWVKQYMIKNDMDFIGLFFDGKINIKPLSERIGDASRWILRFTKEIEKKKTGIQAIL